MEVSRLLLTINTNKSSQHSYRLQSSKLNSEKAVFGVQAVALNLNLSESLFSNICCCLLKKPYQLEKLKAIKFHICSWKSQPHFEIGSKPPFLRFDSFSNKSRKEELKIASNRSYSLPKISWFYCICYHKPITCRSRRALTNDLSIVGTFWFMKPCITLPQPVTRKPNKY